MKLNRYFILLSAIAAAGLNSCSSSTTPATPSSYVVTPLVADTLGYGTTRIEPSLVNAWGLSFDSQGELWVAQNGTASSAAYDSNGIRQKAVTAVTGSAGASGSPTGIVTNPNPASPASFGGNYYLYANEDGTISGFTYLGDTARQVIDRSSYGAIYKGLALATTNGSYSLYAANFKSGNIDVFGQSLSTPQAHTDPNLPAGYAPFGVAALNNLIYVSLAKQDGKDDAPGAGNGYIDVFNLDGSFNKRLVSQGVLNSPWGMAIAPASFGDFKGMLLVGNFGDGTINVFDPNDGSSKGALKYADGTVVKIDGLWALAVNNGVLYYTAGPGHESHGVLGTIKLK